MMLDWLKRIIKRTHLSWLINVCRFVYLHCTGQNIRTIIAKVNRESQCSGVPETAREKVSIICCVWNTNPRFLEEMLDSVENQTYGNWELCINNCSDDGHVGIQDILDRYGKADSRIKILNNPNRGISENSNIAVHDTDGSFLLLLDHDDWLAPHALTRLIECQQKNDADFVYSDEYVFFMKHQIGKLVHKKEFSFEALRADNFINHPVLIRKSLFNKIGGFRSGFEGSQDHDLYFRLAENTTKIQYIPEALYFWRINESSFSQKSLQKCIDSGRKALEEHLHRMHISGKVIADGDSPRYKIILEEAP